MLPNPRDQHRELLCRALGEHPTEPREVSAEVPKPVDGLVRESGILRRLLNLLGGHNRACKVLVAEIRVAHMVGHQTERPPNVKLQSTILTAKLAAREVTAAARDLTCLDEGKPLRPEDAGEFRRATAKYFGWTHVCMSRGRSAARRA